MRVDWVPYSASSLIAGSTALSVGSMLMPRTEDESGSALLDTLADQQWIVVAALFFLAAVALTFGLPAILTVFDERGSRLALAGTGVFGIGCLGIAGYAMLLVFASALAREGVSATAFTDATEDTGLTVFLFLWIGAFYLGELLLAAALLRSGNVPRWVPFLLIVHVALFPVSNFLPPALQSASVLLVTVAFAGVGIQANHRHLQTV